MSQKISDDTVERLKNLVSEHLGIDKEDIKPEASITDDLGADSLDLVELIMALEEEFGIEIGDDQAEKIVKVQDAIDFIESAIKK